MFSRHPWKMIAGWISAVSTNRNSSEWCRWHAGPFPVHCRMSRRDSWRKSKIRWSVHRSSWSLCRSSPAAVWIQAMHKNWVLSEFSFSRFDFIHPSILFMHSANLRAAQSIGRLLGNGSKGGYRRHRSELRRQVMRQWRWHPRYARWRGSVPILIPAARRISVRIDGRWK